MTSPIAIIRVVHVDFDGLVVRNNFEVVEVGVGDDCSVTGPSMFNNMIGR